MRVSFPMTFSFGVEVEIKIYISLHSVIRALLKKYLTDRQ